MDYKGMWERLRKELIAMGVAAEGAVQRAAESGGGGVGLLAAASTVESAKRAVALMDDIEYEAGCREC